LQPPATTKTGPSMKIQYYDYSDSLASDRTLL
jgi:hypothetical protein